MSRFAISLIISCACGLHSVAASDGFVIGSPTNLGPTVNFGADTAVDQMGPTISTDGLSLYFTTGPNYPIPFSADGQERDAQDQQSDIYLATRDSVDGPWSQPQPMGGQVNTIWEENSPTFTADGAEMYFADGWSARILHQMNRQQGESRRADLWVRTWDSNSQSWGEAKSLGPSVNSEFEDFAPSISADGLSLYFASWRPGGSGTADIWTSERTSRDAAWSEPVNLGPQVNTEFNEQDPAVSADGLMLFFSSNTTSGGGPLDLFVSTREQVGDLWGPATNLGPIVNSSGFESGPAISSDGSTLYFVRPGASESGINFDLWQAPVLPQESVALLAGDADQDLDFDQFDLIQVQQSSKYLSGEPTTWGEGDWNGAPGGFPGSPPAGDGVFDNMDIIAAQQGGVYLTGWYVAVQPDGREGDGQASVGYDANTGEVWVDNPANVELTSINIDSSAGIFTGDRAQNLGGSFDNDADGNIFKATFGSSFGSLSFGHVAQAGLSEEFVLGDLTVVGSLAGGGDLGEVDLVYVPEPTSALLLAVGLVIGLFRFGRIDR